MVSSHALTSHRLNRRSLRAQADLSIAQGTLYGDQAVFGQYVGHPPGTLRDPGPPARLMPRTLQAANEIAQAENQAFSLQFSQRARPGASGQGSQRSASSNAYLERKLHPCRAALRRAKRHQFRRYPRIRPAHRPALRGGECVCSDSTSDREPVAAAAANRRAA